MTSTRNSLPGPAIFSSFFFSVARARSTFRRGISCAAFISACFSARVFLSAIYFIQPAHELFQITLKRADGRSSPTDFVPQAEIFIQHGLIASNEGREAFARIVQ